MWMTLEMTYFRAELVQLIVSRSDSELKVQRYDMKKNTVTVDPVSTARWIVNETMVKPSPNRQSLFLKTKPRKPSSRFLNVEVGSVRFLKTDVRNFHRIPHTPMYVNASAWL